MRAEAVGGFDPHVGSRTIDACVLDGFRCGEGIDVGCHDRTTQASREGHAQHAGAASEIERVVEGAPAQEMFEGKEATSCRAVMARAESVGRLDLQADLVRRDGACVVASIEEEAAGLDGWQAIQRAGDPVLVLDRNDAQGNAELLQQCGFIGFGVEESLDLPHAAFAEFEGGDDGIGFELLQRLAQLEGFQLWQDGAGFPAGGHVDQALATKFEMTRFSPALSNRTVSLLPSIDVTRP